MDCPDCGHDNIDGVDACEHCGQELRSIDIPRAKSGLQRTIMKTPIRELDPLPALTVAPNESVAGAIRLMQKERHGFRLTARERRRHDDVETRERELAEGHPLFRHVGIVTVTAADLDGLDDASARVEQAAAQSLLDLRPLAGRQEQGWVASLPLGRSVRKGSWR